MVALLSPVGATHDEAYHLRSIWCGQGERDPYCAERFADERGAYVARTNILTQNCQKIPVEPLLCPPSQTGESVFVTNDGRYPPLFYYLLSWLVVPNVSVSVVIMRLASALTISLLLALLCWLLPPRYRLTLLLIALTAFSATGYFLFASINPSSWTSLGVGVGWLGLHAALSARQLSLMHRGSLVGAALLAWIMAIGSRADGAGFVALTVVLTLSEVGWSRLREYRNILVTSLLLVPMLGWILLERFTTLSPIENIQRFYRYSEGQPDNVSFFSEGFLQGPSNALRALGSIPSKSPIVLPGVVYVISLVVLGLFIINTFTPTKRTQQAGALITAIVVSLVIMAQVAWVDSRDPGGVEPRYVYPLFVFAAGWWYLLGPEPLKDRVGRYLRPASVAATAIFALTMFTVAERFVDKQTFSLRYLPEGLDQWWWSWLPVGPNVVVILAPVFLWRFFTEMRTLIEHDDSELVA